MSQEANSTPEPLPNTEAQAPREISVDSVDRGSRLPDFNPGGGDPHGYGSQADK